MSEPYVGEIRLVGFNFPPIGWAFCDGSILSISQNEVLFTLIGTTYGGDGQNTFALPNLQCRFPIHMGTNSFGSSYVIGQAAGTESVTLTANQIPVHSHVLNAQVAAGSHAGPAGGVWAASALTQFSTVAPSAATMANSVLADTGGSQPHENMPPFQAIYYIISLFGVFPSQN